MSVPSPNWIYDPQSFSSDTNTFSLYRPGWIVTGFMAVGDFDWKVVNPELEKFLTTTYKGGTWIRISKGRNLRFESSLLNFMIYDLGSNKVNVRVAFDPREDSITPLQRFWDLMEQRFPVRSDLPDGVFAIDFNYYFIDPESPGFQSKTYRRDTAYMKRYDRSFYPGIDFDALVSAYANSTENIMILLGAPGTGKTCFVKMLASAMALHNKENIDAAYVKDNRILSDDRFWNNVVEGNSLLIMDDFDNELLPRKLMNEKDVEEGKHYNNNLMARLLSLSDGLFDSEVKIIITTNMHNSKVDPALVRPGRCFDVLRLPPLSRKEAESVWTNTLWPQLPPELKRADPAEEFGRLFDVSSPVISQGLLVSRFQRYAALSGSVSYLRDPSISVRKEYSSFGEYDQ